MEILQHIWGATPEGEAIVIYTIRNANGCEVQLCNIGASIVSVKAPDRDGNIDDIVNQIADIVQQQIQDEPKYPKELLVKSKSLSEFHLHPDIIRAILVAPEYTLSNAKQAIQKYIDSFNR